MTYNIGPGMTVPVRLIDHNLVYEFSDDAFADFDV